MTYVEIDGQAVTHLKADIRGTAWCGETYNVATTPKPPAPTRPVCEKCQRIEDGIDPVNTPPRLFHGGDS